MKKLIPFLLFIFITENLFSQSLNNYLFGIWKMECCSNYYNLYIENKVYTISEVDKDSGTIINFCIPKVLTYEEFGDGRKKYKKSIPLDSVDFDKVLAPDPETGVDEIYLMEYQDNDVINQKEILVTDTPLSLSFYYIDPHEKNQFYVWDGTAPSKIVYYNRILNPPVYVLEFFKKIAPDRFRRIEKSRSYIFDTTKKMTKMYLIKGDEVEVVEEKEEWLRIRYYGNGSTSSKVIEGWIKKTDVE